MENEERGAATCKLVLPEDGYDWKKYGQKFIKSIGKHRSYFKCQKGTCGAKKQAEWSGGEADEVQVHYDGSHNHVAVFKGDRDSGSSASNANQYNLYTQVFGNTTSG